MGVKTKTGRLKMRTALILFALVPMLSTSLLMSTFIIETSSKSLVSITKSGMLETVDGIGTAFDYSVQSTENALQSFVNTPSVSSYILDTSSDANMSMAMSYTTKAFGSLHGCDSLYLVDKDYNAILCSTQSMIGKQLFTNLPSITGFTNVGVAKSAISGNLVMQLVLPVKDANDNIIGYAGADMCVDTLAENFTEVSKLGLDSAYTYFVAPDGTMLYHPNKEKIGKAVENAAVTSIVEQLSSGTVPQDDCIEYTYNDANKYAAYYIGDNTSYIAVLTADKSDALSVISKLRTASMTMAIISAVVFTVIATLVARAIYRPLVVLADTTDKLSTGDMNVQISAKSKIRETVSIINAFVKLESTLCASVSSIVKSADNLITTIAKVDERTANNVESVTQISQAIDEVAKTSQVVASDVTQMGEQVMIMDTTIDHLVSSVNNLHDSSDVMSSASNSATSCMDRVLSNSAKSVESVQVITDKITETNNAISQISAAVVAIEEIASQTSLLSLNASIEAAHAGEAGKGFAVVAGEISSLADQSAESAKEIKSIVDHIILLSNETVSIAGDVASTISDEQSAIDTAKVRFNELSQHINISMNEVSELNSMSGDLDKIKITLGESIQELSAIAEELGASAEEVAASCQTVQEACIETQDATGTMRNMTDDMQRATEFFKL